MTERDHLNWDAAQESIKAAVAELDRLYASIPDTPAAAAKNRVAMALDSLETAADQLAAARQRFAEQQDRASAVSGASDISQER